MSGSAKYKEIMKMEITLHDLARTGDIETFQTISLDKLDLNEKDAQGHSPLMLSAYNGHREFSRYLLGLGADPNSINNIGNSILMEAAFKGHYEIIKHLIETGADMSYTNPKGQSALDVAQIFGRAEAVKTIKAYQKPQKFGLLHTLKNWTSMIA